MAEAKLSRATLLAYALPAVPIAALGLSLGYALSIGATYPLLDWLGFEGNRGATNPPEALFGILLRFVGMPVALLLLASAALWSFPLDEAKQRELRALIPSRRGA